MRRLDTAVRPGRHRTKARLRTTHVIVLAGLAMLGLGLSVGSASADPTAEDWAKIRMCESGGNYSINTGNGYYGAYQFDEGTWLSVGGSGYPNEASPATQDALALKLWRQRGWSPWACAQLVSLSPGTSAPIAVKPAVKPVVHTTPFPKVAKATADKWTNHVFKTVLGRNGGGNFSASLQAGTTSKAKVAARIAVSLERREHIVAKAYMQCLFRSPDRAGLLSHAAQLGSGNLRDLYASLCGSTEAFRHAHGSLVSWVDNLYVGLLGRHATAAEKKSLGAFATSHGRPAAASLLAGSAVFQKRVLDSIYLTMLGRHVDPSGTRTLAPAISDRGVFTAVVRVANSVEFAGKS